MAEESNPPCKVTPNFGRLKHEYATNFYNFTICHHCKETNFNLKMCSACETMFYCSAEHQHLDWHTHKKLCTVIKKTKGRLTYTPGCTAEVFNDYKSSLGTLWLMECDLGLSPAELNMWMFPKVCKVCYSKSAPIYCENCCSVAYCSKEHQKIHKESHKRFCEDLKLSLRLCYYRWKYNVVCDVKIVKPKKSVLALPKDIHMVLQLLGRRTAVRKYSSDHLNNLLLADTHAPAINIVYALETFGFIKKRKTPTDELTIHIVGADHLEEACLRDGTFEFILHWVFNLKTINVILIGPDFLKYTYYNYILCDDCKDMKRKVQVAGCEALYHDVFFNFTTPDIVTVFNSGFNESLKSGNDTWASSIPLLIHYDNVPLLMTAYTFDDLQKDLARFDPATFKYIVKPEKNRYGNVKPMRNWREGEDEIYFESSYIAVITKV